MLCVCVILVWMFVRSFCYNSLSFNGNLYLLYRHWQLATIIIIITIHITFFSMANADKNTFTSTIDCVDCHRTSARTHTDIQNEQATATERERERHTQSQIYYYKIIYGIGFCTERRSFITIYWKYKLWLPQDRRATKRWKQNETTRRE